MLFVSRKLEVTGFRVHEWHFYFRGCLSLRLKKPAEPRRNCACLLYSQHCASLMGDVFVCFVFCSFCCICSGIHAVGGQLGSVCVWGGGGGGGGGGEKGRKH